MILAMLESGISFSFQIPEKPSASVKAYKKKAPP
jgi:hypothetical protein